MAMATGQLRRMSPSPAPFTAANDSSSTILPPTAFAPPMKSRFNAAWETEYHILLQRHLDRNEKARLRMARRRAALKTREPDVVVAAAERERQYQARYRSRNRALLRLLDYNRRLNTYESIHGHDALQDYLKGKQERRRNAQAKRRAKEEYVSDHEDFEDYGCNLGEDELMDDDLIGGEDDDGSEDS
ncbi:hypothetical protein R3P38DRAFT_3177839 [Favolaschia claudopus]|uniref:Uncharacterized protein n=1 Tax=Favolaschia claudopus TaxID=2862362 RepID=A0AAW0CZZ2_9AGAR